MRAAHDNEAALGFAPHSGWAVVVAVGGSSSSPEVLIRGRIDMADPALRGSKQPYHEVEGLPLAEAEQRLKRLGESARAMAFVALRKLMSQLRDMGHVPAMAGILESSGRKGGSLESILRSHALIHTADGDHFREALAYACNRCDIVVHRIRSRELLDRATKALGKGAHQLQASVRALGRSLGAPWDADHKSAALLAWMLLSGKTERIG